MVKLSRGLRATLGGQILRATKKGSSIPAREIRDLRRVLSCALAGADPSGVKCVLHLLIGPRWHAGFKPRGP
jgi:hypothetical protein